MAKQSNTNNFNRAPWAMKPKAFEGFILVTETNRKNAIIQGRILYNIFSLGSICQYRGFQVVEPCFTKGKWRFARPTFSQANPIAYYEQYIHEDLNRESWASSWKHMIDQAIETKSLYINPKDPILKYYQL